MQHVPNGRSIRSKCCVEFERYNSSTLRDIFPRSTPLSPLPYHLGPYPSLLCFVCSCFVVLIAVASAVTLFSCLLFGFVVDKLCRCLKPGIPYFDLRELEEPQPYLWISPIDAAHRSFNACPPLVRPVVKAIFSARRGFVL